MGYDSARASVVRQVFVGCGVCSECLKKKRQEFAVRFQREAHEIGSCFFITLTYRDSRIPLSLSYEQINMDTGEISYISPVPVSRDDYPVESSKLFSLPKSREGTYYRRRLLDAFGCENYMRLTYAANTEHVQALLHQFRKEFKKQEGEYPRFSYAVVSENGSHTARPHYHLAILPRNFSWKWIHWLESYWKSRNGFVDIRKVNLFNEDKSNGAQLVGKYMAKYLFKGSDYCNHVALGLVKRPRTLLSQSFGVRLSDELKPFHLGFDSLGEYNPDSLTYVDGRKMSDSDIQKAISIINDRLYYPVISKDNYYKQSLPEQLKRKLFGYVSKTDKTLHRWYTIYRMAKKALVEQLNADYDKRVRQNPVYLSSGDYAKANLALQAILLRSQENEQSRFDASEVISFNNQKAALWIHPS